MSNNSQRYATHEDFSSFKKEVREDFEGLRHDFKMLSNDISHQFAKFGRTDWNVVIASVGVFLTISTLAGSLVYFMITAEGKTRSTQLQTIERQLSAMDERWIHFIENEYEPVEARSIRSLENTAILAAQLKDFDNLKMRVNSLEISDSSLSEKIKNSIELAHSNTSRIEGMDTVLQREMRLLDDVLQREMGLHVDRLDELIRANAKNSTEQYKSQAEKIASIMANRFTQAEGQQIREQLKEKANKQ